MPDAVAVHLDVHADAARPFGLEWRWHFVLQKTERREVAHLAVAALQRIRTKATAPYT